MYPHHDVLPLLRFNLLFIFYRTDSEGMYVGVSVLIGAHSHALRRHSVKHCLIRQSSKEQRRVQQCTKPRISDTSVVIQFDNIDSHHIFG